jgi:protein-L-isoaspartate(D-aspartate) O-methyltransferase
VSATPSISRQRLVRKLSDRGIANEAVLAAIGDVPRERFVDEALRLKAYADVALPIGEKQTISQPWIVARMTELLDPDGSGRTLEIGSGSGYQAAVLSRLCEQVYSVERIPELSRRALRTIRALGIENVHLKIFDGTYGWGEFAPYRGIVVTAGAPSIPQPLVEQLADGGRMVLPIGDPDAGPDADQTLVRVIKRRGRIIREDHGPCRFVPLVGKFGWNP